MRAAALRSAARPAVRWRCRPADGVVVVRTQRRTAKSLASTRPERLAPVRAQLLQDPSTTAYPRIERDPRALTVGELWERHRKVGSGKREADVVVTVRGRITRCRDASSKLRFYDVFADGNKLQVVVNLKTVGGERDEFVRRAQMLRVGDIVSATGHPGRTDAGELSLFATSYLTLLAPSLHMLPPPTTDRAKLHLHRHIELLVSPRARQTLRLRSALLSYTRAFFLSRSFTEVQTPILSSHVGGAAATPFLTRLDNDNDAADNDNDDARNDAKNDDDDDAAARNDDDARTRPRGLALRIAPELWLKRLVIGGLDRVFELGPQFRNEGVDATHNPEFYTCEFYQAYAGLEELVETTETFFVGAAETVRARRKTEWRDLTPAYLRSPRDPEEGEEGEEGDEEAGEKAEKRKKPQQKKPQKKKKKKKKPGDDKREEAEEAKLLEAETRFWQRPFKRLEFIPALEAALGEPLPPLDDDDAAALPALTALFARHSLPLPASPPSVPKLLDRLASTLLEPRCDAPTFITHHPAALSPLAKHATDAHGRRVALRAELFVRGRELVNAYEEENSPAAQRAKFGVQQRHSDGGDGDGGGDGGGGGDISAVVGAGRTKSARERQRAGSFLARHDDEEGSDESFCRALEWGLPPTAGWGLGVDRFVMLFSGRDRIGDVLSFGAFRGVRAGGGGKEGKEKVVEEEGEEEEEEEEEEEGGEEEGGEEEREGEKEKGKEGEQEGWWGKTVNSILRRPS